MKVAVTGAQGHLGSNLVRLLLERGDEVCVLVRTPRQSLDDLDVEVVEGDVRDPDAVKRCIDGADTVFHLAAKISIDGDRDGSVRSTNVDGVRCVAEAALSCGVRRMLHTSSIHAFDLMREDEVLTESTPRASGSHHHAYDRSKAAGEQALRSVIVRGLDAVVVNPVGVIGPRDFAPSRMGRVFIDMFRGKLPAVPVGGFHWVDVRDVVDGMLAAVERGRVGESYILSGQWASFRELTDRVERITGVRAPRFTVPLAVLLFGAPFSTAVARLQGIEPRFTLESVRVTQASNKLSCDKAARELGYQPRPLDDTIADLHEWFGAQGMLDGR